MTERPNITDIPVRLHSTEPAAVESVRRTIEAMGSFLIERDGQFYVSTLNPGYMRFALIQQGYVAAVDVRAATREGGKSR